MAIVTVIDIPANIVDYSAFKEAGYRYFRLVGGYLVLMSEPVELSDEDIKQIAHLLSIKNIPILPINYKTTEGRAIKVHPLKACQACHINLSNSIVGLCSQCRVKLGNEMKAPVVDNDEDDYEARKLWKKDKNNE